MNKKIIDTYSSTRPFQDLKWMADEEEEEIEEAKTREEEVIDEKDDSDSVHQKYNFTKKEKIQKEKTTKSMKKLIKEESERIRKQLIEELEGTPNPPKK